MRKRLYFFVLWMVASISFAHAQYSNGNPFSYLGYKAAVGTFGSKEEFHDQQVLVEIGSVYYDTQSKKVVGFVESKDPMVTLSPDIISMSIDPHAEKYYSISPYAFVMNNPMRYIDPDGRDVWEMDHQGKVRWIEESKIHTMYALNADGERTGNSITLQNRTVFDNLTSSGLSSDYSATYSWGNPSELASVFLFAADNSNAEWRFSRFDVGNGDQYAIGTIHDAGTSISTRVMGFAQETEIAFIHSHPTPYGSVKAEWNSMGWRTITDTEAAFFNKPKNSPRISGDSSNVQFNTNNHRSFNNYFTYFPNSGNIYHVRGAQHPAFIKNIKNHNYNPQRLFWGKLNGR